VLVAQGRTIAPADLTLSRRGMRTGDVPDPQADALISVFRRLFDQDTSSLYDHVTEKLVRAALDHCEGNQVQTARLLGISRNVLRSHLTRIGLIAARAKTIADAPDAQPPNNAG
jgi:sigma-54 dependent transcriptional regulator